MQARHGRRRHPRPVHRDGHRRQGQRRLEGRQGDRRLQGVRRLARPTSSSTAPRSSSPRSRPATSPKAKSLYAQARHPWEAIEPVAESFGDLDPKIDGREDVIADGMAFTGYHRLEKDLWKDGLQKDSGAIADQLLADVTEIAAKSKTVEPTALSIANGAKALLDEVATGKITGEEERYSHTDLWDFDGNLEGSRQALAVLRPVIAERDPALQKALDADFTELSSLLAKHKTGADYKSYTALTDADIKELTVSLDALSEQVSKVPGVVEAT